MTKYSLMQSVSDGVWILSKSEVWGMRDTAALSQAAFIQDLQQGESDIFYYQMNYSLICLSTVHHHRNSHVLDMYLYLF